MPRGRPPKPVALRQLEAGSHAGRSVVSHRPIPPRIEFSDSLADVTLTPPENLGPAGVRCWEESVVPLARCGALHAGDLSSARLMCESYDEHARASEIIEREGLIARSSRGTPMTHPAVRIAHAASERFLQLARELGCTPASRTRIGLDQIRGTTLAADLQATLGFNPRRTERPRR